jgi:hypothetical protein
MANVTGLTVTINARAGFNVQQQGLQNSNSKMVLYGSSETHSACVLQRVVVETLEDSFGREPREFQFIN